MSAPKRDANMHHAELDKLMEVRSPLGDSLNDDRHARFSPFNFKNPQPSEHFMKTKLNAVINRCISPLGVEIRRQGAVSPIAAEFRNRLHDAIEEMEKVTRETIFPDLPRTPGRHELMMQLLGTQLSEALHVVGHLNRAIHLEGDVCEFGIAQGATSALIANEIAGSDKTLWLFDSFEGLPMPTDRDVLIDDIFNLGSIEKYQGTMACGVEQVTDRLNSINFPFSRVKIIPGFIEETAKFTNLPPTICFAYVDFDFYEPIKIALELLDTRLSIGGLVMVDDYGFFSAGAQAAVDEFVASRKKRYSKEDSPGWASCFCVLRRIS